MQTLPGQEHFHTVSVGTQTRNVVLIALVFFALAGLISGFTVGAFLHSHQTGQIKLPSQASNTQTKPQQTVTTAPSSAHPLPLGDPVIDSYQWKEIADGSTMYSFAGHVVNKQNILLRTSSVTCKIWLTKDGNVDSAMTEVRLQSVSTLALPFADEVPGVLLFSTATPQTQMCLRGRGAWSYQIAPTTKPGYYFIVLLTDWGGIHYNWSWIQIRIVSQGQG
jgi:hypothetical protein